jgi:cytoplasmic iron level regulating protein YaaA (DUF328/UPF0246 family)
MLILLSPAKKLDYSNQSITENFTIPENLPQSEKLINALRKLQLREVCSLMDLSEDLGQLNVNRYASWKVDFTQGELKQAILAFNGEVYQGMDANHMSASDLEFAQNNLRILSGLHGLLRPLDLIKPYRLEMGTKLNVGINKNLHSFWGDSITDRCNADLKAVGSSTIINLASAEYFKAVNLKKLEANVITPSFKDLKNGQLKSLFLYIKQARGMMAGFAIRNRITNPEELKAFNGGGYRYTESLSDETNWVFTR